MVNRVTNLEVKEIITTDKVDIQPYITAANLLVTDVLGSTTNIVAAQLKEIERWLAAHFVAMAGNDTEIGEILEDEIGETRVKYAASSTSLNLSSSRYGKQAMLLDTTGKLASLGRGRAVFRAVGITLT